MSSTSLKGFLQEKSAARFGSADPRVYLAAFGKHPGWNDHIDDLGFETESLIIAKRFIYLDGIASQIDTGAWDRLEPAARFSSFDHYLLWQRGQEILCAVLVDSRDGKGRTRYPMVLCLHAISVSLDRVTVEFAPVIDQAMRDCMAVNTADEVIAILDAARGELRRRLAGAPAPPPVHVPLVNDPALGPASEGLFRLLYQVKNQFAAWTRGNVDYDDEESLPRPASLRAPQATADFPAGAGAWMDLFHAQLGDEPPVLLLWPRSATWFDVVVGAPDPAAFFALKAGAGAIPLATEVPYQFDDTFRAEALAAAEEFSRGADATRTIFGAAAPATKKRNRTGRQLGRAKRAMAEGGRSVSGWWGSWSPTVVRSLIAVFLVLVLGVAGLIYWATRAVDEVRPDNARSASSGARDIDAVTLTAWRELCASSYEWFGRFYGEMRDPARRARWKQDPELRTKVIEKIETHEGRLASFSPQQLTGTSGAVQTLRSMQPAALARPEVALKVRQAAEVVNDIGRAIHEWGGVSRLAEIEKRLESRGWTGPLAELAAVRGAFQLDAHTARSVDALLARQTELKLIAQRLDEIETWATLRAADDPFLSSWIQVAEAEARAVTSLTELREGLFRRTEGLADVIAVLRDPAFDRAKFATESSTRFDPMADTAAQVGRWLEQARGFTSLPSAERPLPEAAWATDTAPLRRAIVVLKQLGSEEEVAAAVLALAELDLRYETFRQLPATRRDLPRLRELAAVLEADRGMLGRRFESTVNRLTNPTAWIAALRESRIEGSAVVSAEWQRRRDALIAEVDPNKGIEAFLALQQAATRVEDFLRAAAAAPEMPLQVPGAEAFAAVFQRRREAALAEVLKVARWTNGQPDKSWAEFAASPEAREAMAEFWRQQGEIMYFAAWMQRVARQLDRAADWETFPPADREVPAADADVLGLPLAEQIIERLRHVKMLAEANDRTLLVKESTATDLAVAMQAWRSLGKLSDWPANAAEQRAEQEARERIRKRMERLDDAFAKVALGKELQAEGRRRWNVGAAKAKSGEDWHELFAAARASGIDVAALGPHERYNEWLWRLKQTPWHSLGGEEFVARRSAFLAELERLPEAVRGPEGWVAQLGGISTASVPIDFSKVGPGAAGWRLIESPDPNVLSYEWKAPGARTTHRLDFRLLEPVIDRPVYLATTEFPVGLFLEWIEARSLWPELLAQMRDFIEEASATPHQEIRRGPRVFVYNVAARKFSLATNWIAKAGYYPPNGTPPPPDANSPVNYLTPGAAELLAQSLNCRLPTIGEWQSAYRSVVDRTVGAAAMPVANRRDATWQKQADFVMAQDSSKDRIRPDEESYYPPAVFPIAGIVKPAAVKEDDGVLWFRGVAAGGAERFHNLVGNVAEFVIDPTSPSAPKAVIGASALSVAEIEVAVPYPAAARGYSDVGLRVAFTLDRLTAGQRAAQLVQDAPYRR